VTSVAGGEPAEAPRHYRALLEDMPVDLRGEDPFAGRLASPLALLRERQLDANIVSMQQWCTDRGVELAPHGKTTMSPDLFARQLAAGAWGITVASPAQARVALRAGARRILIANQVTDVAGIRWLGRTASAQPDLFLACYVDALRGVELLEEGLADVLPDGQRLDVLIELGLPGGRTGARTEDDALEVAEAVAHSRRLRLAGVSGYEGVAASLGGAQPLQAVIDFCTRLGDLAARLLAEHLVEPSADRPLVLSAGGSAWFDGVVPTLTAARERLAGTPAVVVIRSGAYVTHDHGLYSRVTPLARGGDGPVLSAAWEVWGRVLSRPEPTRAIVDVGRRDAPFDQDLPLALWCRPAAGGASSALTARVVDLNDQHAFLDVPADAVLSPGDWVGFGISHPCTAVDKWNVVLLVDDRERIVAQLPTFF
jgi:D-serine deaminase-like pyridoxal phosphate-dependent protein